MTRYDEILDALEGVQTRTLLRRDDPTLEEFTDAIERLMVRRERILGEALADMTAQRDRARDLACRYEALIAQSDEGYGLALGA